MRAEFEANLANFLFMLNRIGGWKQQLEKIEIGEAFLVLKTKNIIFPFWSILLFIHFQR